LTLPSDRIRCACDTLVVDTIGLNDKTFIDNYRTPHTAKLHVVERYQLIDDGKTLQVTFRVDDPDTFYQPWSPIGQLIISRRYRFDLQRIGRCGSL
jgi:hypothetical protein